ncbi:MAG: hypothetical protein ABIT37_20145 [Luteolibacter sp.]
MKIRIALLSLVSCLAVPSQAQQGQKPPLPTEHTKTGETPNALSPAHLFGEWFCDGLKTDVYRLNADKTAQHFSARGAWQLVNGVLTISWANGYRLTIEISQTGSTITGNSYAPGSNHADPLSFTKVGHEAPPILMPGTEVTRTPEDYLPVNHTLTDSSGRKIEATILSKSETIVKFRRVSDGKDYEMPIAKLSAEDQNFLNELGKPVGIYKTKLDLTVAGESIQVSRLGQGPVGVIFFGTSSSETMMRAILDKITTFKGLLPTKTSFFLWEYPGTGSFREVGAAIADYTDGDKKKIRPDFKGVATSVLAQIREKTGLKEFLLVGNSLGAGIILWDYKELASDPKVSFLLISPTEAFMPPVSDIGELQRTMMLAAHGRQTDPDEAPDLFLKGREARRWVESNLDTRTLRKISTEPQSQPVKRGQESAADPRKADFSQGHKTIGNTLKVELLDEILKMKLGTQPAR